MRDENSIYEDWRVGNEAARAELLEEFIDAIRNHAQAVVISFLGHVEKDVVENVVTSVLTHIDDFKGESKFSTWIHRTALNACHDWLRAKYRRREVPLDACEETLPVAPDDNAIHDRLLLKQITKGLNKKDTAILLGKLQGESYEEISQRLKLTPEGVRTRWLRLRRRLSGGDSSRA